jgi:hypothetical protein
MKSKLFIFITLLTLVLSGCGNGTTPITNNNASPSEKQKSEEITSAVIFSGDRFKVSDGGNTNTYLFDGFINENQIEIAVFISYGEFKSVRYYVEKGKELHLPYVDNKKLYIEDYSFKDNKITISVR